MNDDNERNPFEIAIKKQIYSITDPLGKRIKELENEIGDRYIHRRIADVEDDLKHHKEEPHPPSNFCKTHNSKHEHVYANCDFSRDPSGPVNCACGKTTLADKYTKHSYPECH